MTRAEAVYNSLPEERKKYMIDIMMDECPFDHNLKGDCNCGDVKYDRCFECWMKPVEGDEK